ncbi:MAG TPA: LamG domain-containing protein [Kofleriaceae bacterium]|nr:LamG domain-containing protein [Kofleriaceae bacterium]
MRALLLVGLGACRFAHGEAAPDAVPPFCDPDDATLVACYELDGEVQDGSPHHLDPDVTDNVAFGAGKVGQAMVIGATTEVDVAESPLFGVSALTIEAWIAPSQLPSDRGGVLDCDGRYGFFLYASDQIECIAGGTATAGPIATQQWTHVACTSDGTAVSVYIDGRLAASAPATALSPTGSQTGITIGGNNPPGGGDPLVGSLDQLRLYGVARTPAEICADAAAPCD